MKVSIKRNQISKHNLESFLKDRIKLDRKIARRIAHEGILSKLISAYNAFNGDRAEIVKVKIDYYDVWNADYTLSHIIHPILLKLREEKHGTPFVDDEDVPETLRSTNASPKENDHDLDEFFHARWEWVLGEMIWAFNQSRNGNDEEPMDIKSKDWTWRTRIYEKRMKRGHALFGKYYGALWS